MDLRDVSLGTLRALRAALAGRALATPVTEAGLSGAGLGRSAQALAARLSGFDSAALETLLDCVIAEREHPGAALELVWTGPGGPADPVRDTGVVMRQLFGLARASVLVAGFRIDDGEQLFQPLHRVMTEHGVDVTFIVDIHASARTEGMAEAVARAEIDRVFEKQWPFEGERPAIYFDPRTAVRGSVDRPWASMHAKCIVVDRRHTLITSANFTDRGQTRNIELGVRIDDPDFATEVDTRWRTLIRQGHLLRAN